MAVSHRSRFNMQRDREIDMEVIVIGVGRLVSTRCDIEKLRQRAKVVLVPGDELIIYRADPRTGFQEIDGAAAELYLSQIR
jgi:RecB family endonuclease NucS